MKWLCFVIFAAVSPLLAQNFTFEVASVKESKPGLNGTGITTDRAGFRTENTTLHDLIAFALRVQHYQITGGPDWLNDAHFDVTARNESSEEKDIPEEDRKSQEARDDRIRVRLRQLLAERFQLRLREEKKEMSVYALAVDKAGPKFKEAPPKGNMSVNRSNASGSIQADGVDIDRFVRTLGNILEKPVVDQTGLTGTYDIALKFTLDTSATGKESEELVGASLFTALKEQLGLRLTGKKGPVSVWVIEKAEKPGEN